MRVIIPELTEDQAQAVIKAIRYHFSNEGVCCDTKVEPACCYFERSQPLLPARVKIETDNWDKLMRWYNRFSRQQTAVMMEGCRLKNEFNTEEEYRTYLEQRKERLKRLE